MYICVYLTIYLCIFNYVFVYMCAYLTMPPRQLHGSCGTRCIPFPFADFLIYIYICIYMCVYLDTYIHISTCGYIYKYIRGPYCIHE